MALIDDRLPSTPLVNITPVKDETGVAVPFACNTVRLPTGANALVKFNCPFFSVANRRLAEVPCVCNTFHVESNSAIEQDTIGAAIEVPVHNSEVAKVGIETIL